MKNLLPFLLLLISLTSVGQDQCHFFVADSAEMKTLEAKIQSKAKSDDETIYRIPLVIHNVYKTVNGNQTGDISIQQMASQVDFMNEIYNAQRGSIASGPSHGIEFYLANKLPDGTAFNGLIQYDIDDLDISEADKQLYKDCGVRNSGCGLSDLVIKSEIFLPNQSYYNVLIVTEIDNNGAGSGVQGYAYFPTISISDGVTQMYNNWGVNGSGYYPDCTSFCANLKSYTNKGATGVHEIGHAFGLLHTFQGGTCNESDCSWQGDRVCDTPPTVLNSSCSSAACSGTQQVENYMDYTSQTCKDLLTAGQGERMRLTLANSRTNLINNFGNSHEWLPTTIDVDFNLPLAVCSTNQDYDLTITSTGQNTLERLKIRYGSSESNADTIEVVLCLLPNQYKTITLPPLETAGATVGIDILEVNTLPYEFEPDIHTSQVGNIEVVVRFSPDVLGGQNGWEIKRNGEVVVSREEYPNFSSDQTFSDTVCVKSGCIEFRFYDVVGNGVCCQNGEGSLDVLVNGNVYATLPEDFTDEWVIGNCEPLQVKWYNTIGQELDPNNLPKGELIFEHKIFIDRIEKQTYRLNNR